MIQALIGKKIEQTQKFLTDGTRIPVTVITVSPNTVTQIKTSDKEGYSAVQVAFGARKKSTQALRGHIKAAKLSVAPSVLHEVALADEAVLPTVGDSINASDVLKVGDIIKVTGIGKGKGFAGGVKRHQFKGGPRTHGQSDRERAPGSIGQTTTPGRVYKGKRMAGRMGSETVSVTNLVIVDVAGEKVLVKGLVPGSVNSIVYLQKTGELKNPLELYNDKPAEEVVEEVASPAEEPAKVEESAKEEVQVAAKEEVTAVEAVEAKPEEIPAPVEESSSNATEVKTEEPVKEEKKEEKS